jgi:hypothetical protein
MDAWKDPEPVEVSVATGGMPETAHLLKPEPPPSQIIKEGHDPKPKLYELDPDLYDLHERTMKHIFSPKQAEELQRRINKHKNKKMKKSKKSEVTSDTPKEEKEERLQRIREIMKKTGAPNEGFLNESGLAFSDISSEKKREYTFPNGKKLFINKPLYLNVSASGGHRLYAEDNTCYYVQPEKGWYIKWKPRKGKPSFVK